MKSFLSLTILLLALGLASAFLCPHDNGYFRHPTDPHKFYQCINQREFEYNCPVGTVWNQSIHQCDYTTGPLVDPTDPPVHIPHGDRVRHTTEADKPQEEVTTQAVDASTRGRHHE